MARGAAEPAVLRLTRLEEPRAPTCATPLAVRPVGVLRVAIMLSLIGNLGRLPFIGVADKQAPLLVVDLLTLAVLAVGCVAMMRAAEWHLDVVAAIALAFAFVGAVSALVATVRFGLTGFQLVFSLAYLARWLLYFGLYVVLINTARASDVGAVWRALEWSVLAFAAFGIFQSAFLPGFAQIVYPDAELYSGWDPQGRRLVSTLLDPNFAGALILLVLLVHLGRMASGAPVRPWKPLLLLTAVLLTLSRSTLLALGVGAAVIVVARGGIPRRHLRFGALVGLLAAPFVPSLLDFARSFNKLGVDASALARVVLWLRAIRVFGDNPIIGVGFNTYGFVQRAYGYEPFGAGGFGLDGGLLFVAVMTGVVGVALYVGMLGVVVARCRRVWRAAWVDAEVRGLAIGIAAGTVAIVVHSVFVNTLLLPFIMQPLWVLWGLAFLVRLPARAAQRR